MALMRTQSKCRFKKKKKTRQLSPHNPTPSPIKICTSLQLLCEVLDGIKVYFDFTLLDHLLYGPEKEQHKLLGILNPVFSKKGGSTLPPHLCDGSAGQNASCVGEQHLVCGRFPSQVYGPIHLLRLFVKMPHFLSCTQLPLNHVQLLQNYFCDLLT